MIYLLDTNVISQRMALRPHEAAFHFLDALPQEDAFLSVVSILEIRAGIEMLDVTSGRRERLEPWLTRDIPKHYAGRILPVTLEVADAAGRLLVMEKKHKRTPHIPDLLLAATAHAYGMTIATLNRKHFESLGVPLVDL